ncbi:hypothetical protein SDC9_136093 [bioreactor metagenome]|uniref:Uncharacterized protein n=1 Tax=bioreactor metagenome TaxID=1076179 RepID=A0A645DID0_9ZZZZ
MDFTSREIRDTEQEEESREELEGLVERQVTVGCWRESANDERIFMISDGSNPVGIYHGEFDPGSEQTLAACLKHAS